MTPKDNKQDEEGTIIVGVKDIDFIKDTLIKLNAKVDSLDKTATKLNTTIVGDLTYGQIGLIVKVKENSDYIEQDKSFKSKLIGGGLVLGALWTIILKLFDKIF